jgi:DNA-binding HxlR family transcriptional regulator
MASRRRYGEACPVAHALDVVGERWALLVVRELRLGPKRYSDLAASLPGAGPNVLAQRLRDLEDGGVLRRRTLPPPAGARVYELTPWGAELEPVFRALARWGVRSPVPRQGRLSADSIMLGLRTFFDTEHASEPARRWTALYEFRLDHNVFRLRVVDGRLEELVRGDAAGAADVVASGPQTGVQALLDGGAQPPGVTVTGDRSALDRLLAAVRPPITSGKAPARFPAKPSPIASRRADG